jgi:hypothetical protein
MAAGFSQMFSLNASVDTILSNPYTPANYVDPMAPSARQALLAIAAAAPTVCGGGVYFYGGREGSIGVAHGFVGSINEFDSNIGHTSGTLIEGGVSSPVGPTVGGGAFLGAPGGTQVLATGGGGVETPVVSASAGVVGFTQRAGIYGEGFLLGHGGGVGAYLNITTNAGCPKKR